VAGMWILMAEEVVLGEYYQFAVYLKFNTDWHYWYGTNCFDDAIMESNKQAKDRRCEVMIYDRYTRVKVRHIKNHLEELPINWRQYGF
jgi:queuine/archaeosine tRNA-ribosyltransferase